MDDNISRFEVVLFVKHGSVRIYDTDNGIEVNCDPDGQGRVTILDEDDLHALQRAIVIITETRGV